MLSRLAPRHLGRSAFLLTLAALMLWPAGALAGGTWTSTDLTAIDVSWRDDAGAKDYFEVFTFPVPVSGGTVLAKDTAHGAGAACQPGTNGVSSDPNSIECRVSPIASSGKIRVTLKSKMACTGMVGHRVSRNNASYVDQQPITETGSPQCHAPGGGGSSKKPCKCSSFSLKLDPTLINKSQLSPSKHDFGVGFTWTMACKTGKGGCKAKVRFLPPEVLAGSVPKPAKGFHLNIKRLKFICKAKCGKGKSGRFQIKMLSKEQLNKLFGRTLAYTVVLTCSGQSIRQQVKVFVDQKGKLHPA